MGSPGKQQTAQDWSILDRDITHPRKAGLRAMICGKEILQNLYHSMAGYMFIQIQQLIRIQQDKK